MEEKLKRFTPLEKPSNGVNLGGIP